MRRNHRSIRVLVPGPIRGFSYAYLALESKIPHRPDHDCLACADARIQIGMPPLEPELAQRARRMRERMDGLEQIGDEPLAGSAGLLLCCVAVSLGVIAFWSGLRWALGV